MQPQCAVLYVQLTSRQDKDKQDCVSLEGKLDHRQTRQTDSRTRFAARSATDVHNSRSTSTTIPLSRYVHHIVYVTRDTITRLSLQRPLLYDCELSLACLNDWTRSSSLLKVDDLSFPEWLNYYDSALQVVHDTVGLCTVLQSHALIFTESETLMLWARQCLYNWMKLKWIMGHYWATTVVHGGLYWVTAVDMWCV